MTASPYSQILMQAGSRHTPTVWQLAPFFAQSKSNGTGYQPGTDIYVWPPTTTQKTILMTAPDNPPRLNTLVPPGQSLSKEHEHELLDGSGISREFMAARGYYTATRRSEVPEVFPEWQRRLGLVVPLHSPDGKTVGYQLKPKKPRSKGPRYETPAGSRNVLDLNPLMLSALRNTAVPLWITEGAKKVDALASWGRCAIGLSGVWNWLLKGGDPLPCWRHVPLQGRRVYIAFDSDWRTNPSVQRALARLVAFLEGQGAT